MKCSSTLAMQQYSIEPATGQYVKEVLWLARKHQKHLLNTGLDDVKTSKKVVHKAG